MDFEFRTKLLECDTIKLWTIVNYDCLRDPKSANDVIPNEFRDVFVFDASICFRLYPFAEIVRGNK